MKYSEPLSWMINLNPTERLDIISWFNKKMDALMSKMNMSQFNNPNNLLVDIVDYLHQFVSCEIAPDISSTTVDVRYFVSITEDTNDIDNLTYQYCLNRFNQVIC